MKRCRTCFGMAALIVAFLAPVAYAGFFPSPFEFSFFSTGLTNLFLLPLQLAGCG